ncbi:peptidase inhibitor family I36 protein [Streptomyces sp. NPDC093085]|uniref:peptidase inhibitor family I36 protein n=1 Tax=Streptomyces sp. NPDC093085 TaxID=3155068 RepID=UPI00342C499D
MRKISTFLATAGAAVLLAGVTAGPAPAAPQANPYDDCDKGYFCIYSEYNGGRTKEGKSSKCQWSQEKLANTADNCSFIQKGKNVKSVFNKTKHRVQYYTQTNYKNRVGSTASGKGGNLQGNYQIRSFKPQ